MKEIEATKKSVDKTATATSSQLNKLAQTAKFSVLEQNAEASKKAGAKAKPVVANFPTQTAAAAVVIDRRPSLEGLSKSVNGDLIGVKGDNIFKMINRRYQDKEQQIWFFGQYQ